MKGKLNKKNKEKFIGLKITEKQKNKIKLNANLYTNGNISRWVRFASLNYVPTKQDIEEGP